MKTEAECQSDVIRFEYVTRGFEMEEGPQTNKDRWSLEARKGKETDSPLEIPEATVFKDLDNNNDWHM